MNKQNSKRVSKTDWKRLDKMQDKDNVTLRLDQDALAWFRQQGRGYQTKINAILKAYMRSHRSSY